LFIYVRNDALARPEVADFANFYLDTVASVIGDVGYVEAPADAIASAKAALQAAIG
jgi:phosphate transport system substrate-binding protein